MSTEKQCLKCGYIQRIDDVNFTKILECPQCGVVYEKYEKYLVEKNSRPHENNPEDEGGKKTFQGEAKKSPLISYLKNSRLFQWFIVYKDTFASYLYKLWLIGCGYWIYQLIVTDPQNSSYLSQFINLGQIDSREAMVFLFFGGIVSFFLLIITLFLLKLLFNIIWENIKCRFPDEWRSFITVITLLVALYFSFPTIGIVKAFSLDAYQQVKAIMTISKSHRIIIKSKTPSSLPLDKLEKTQK